MTEQEFTELLEKVKGNIGSGKLIEGNAWIMLLLFAAFGKNIPITKEEREKFHKQIDEEIDNILNFANK